MLSIFFSIELNNCAICLELMDENTHKLEKLYCNHEFHFDWFEAYKITKARFNRVKCPLWRAIIRFNSYQLESSSFD